MRNRKIAIALAFFLGTFGVHRFYLGQVARGVFYAIFFSTFIPTILGIIDALVFMGMSDDEFDRKYNRNKEPKTGEHYQKKYEKKTYTGANQRETPHRKSTIRPGRANTTIQKDRSNLDVLKKEGMQLYREFNYVQAIEKFEKALEIRDNDVSIHFNLGCAYSLTENAEKSFDHIHAAVKYGFRDLDKIATHEALSFIRVHPLFDAFRQSQYEVLPEFPKPDAVPETQTNSSAELPPPNENPDILEELRQLERMKMLGVLTEEEFEEQKKTLYKA
jgi:TM2 domain-containing membrane protein YozV